MPKVKMHSIPSKDYPDWLANTPGQPSKLYYRGNIGLLHQQSIAVVGSRRMTKYGAAAIEAIVPDLASSGFVITSGLALGCDAYAQKAALSSSGKVIAVLPTPVDNIYPRTNLRLADEILENDGLLISEYSSGAFIGKANFLRRNGIVSAVSQGVVVIEASQRSGTLSTVKHALEQGREVMAVPGDIFTPSSKGVNSVIKNGAHLVESADDVLSCLGWARQSNTEKLIVVDDPNQQKVIEAIRGGHHAPSQIKAASEMSIDQLNQAITMLEISGHIFSPGDNIWHLR